MKTRRELVLGKGSAWVGSLAAAVVLYVSTSIVTYPDPATAQPLRPRDPSSHLVNRALPAVLVHPRENARAYLTPADAAAPLAFHQRLQSDPDFISGAYHSAASRGAALFAQNKNLPAARKILADERSPPPLLRIQRAVIAARTGQTEAAIADLAAAMRQDTAEARAYYAIALRMVEQLREDPAAKSLSLRGLSYAKMRSHLSAEDFLRLARTAHAQGDLLGAALIMEEGILATKASGRPTDHVRLVAILDDGGAHGRAAMWIRDIAENETIPDEMRAHAWRHIAGYADAEGDLVRKINAYQMAYKLSEDPRDLEAVMKIQAELEPQGELPHSDSPEAQEIQGPSPVAEADTPDADEEEEASPIVAADTEPDEDVEETAETETVEEEAEPEEASDTSYAEAEETEASEDEEEPEESTEETYAEADEPGEEAEPEPAPIAARADEDEAEDEETPIAAAPLPRPRPSTARVATGDAKAPVQSVRQRPHPEETQIARVTKRPEPWQQPATRYPGRREREQTKRARATPTQPEKPRAAPIVRGQDPWTKPTTRYPGRDEKKQVKPEPPVPTQPDKPKAEPKTVSEEPWTKPETRYPGRREQERKEAERTLQAQPSVPVQPAKKPVAEPAPPTTKTQTPPPAPVEAPEPAEPVRVTPEPSPEPGETALDIQHPEPQDQLVPPAEKTVEAPPREPQNITPLPVRKARPLVEVVKIPALVAGQCSEGLTAYSSLDKDEDISPLTHFAAAECYRSRGDNTDALIALNLALQATDEDDRETRRYIWQSIGGLQEYVGNFHAAARAWEQAHDISRGPADRIQWARAERLGGNVHKAQGILKPIVPARLKADVKPAYYDEIAASWAEDDPDRALGALDAALALHNTPGRHVAMAEIHEKQGNRKARTGALEMAAALEPGNAATRHALTYAYMDQGEYAQAAESFGQLTALEPNDPKILIDYGHALRKSGEHSRAAATFRLAVDRMQAADGTRTLASEDRLYDARREVGEIEQDVYALATFIFQTGEKGQSFTNFDAIPDRSQASFELGWHPGFFEEWTGTRLTAIARIMGGFDPDSLRYDDDTTQVRAGLRWHPLPHIVDWSVAAEYLLAMGADVDDNWLLSTRLKWEDGDEFKPHRKMWNVTKVHTEATFGLAPDFIALYAELMQGRALRIAEDLAVIPHVSIQARYFDDDTDSQTLVDAGAGASLRFWFRDDTYFTHQSYLDLALQYRHYIDNPETGEDGRFFLRLLFGY